MSDDLEKILHEIRDDIKVIKGYIPSTDRVSNIEYCQSRGMTRRNLDKWFAKGCPREDNRHVSISKVDKWAEENNTRKPKQTK